MAVLIRNALVVTQNDQREVIQGCDVLIEGNRIAKVGRELQAKAEQKIDATGKALMPGLVNTHNHMAMSLLRGYGDDMVLQEWLEKKIWPREGKLKAGDVYAGSLLACAEMIRGGTTASADMYFFMDEAAKAVEKSGMRANLSYGMIDLGDEGKRKKELAAGEKFVKEWNGKAGGRIACSFGPHSPYTASTELLEKSGELAKKHDVKVQIHLSETRKEVADCLKQRKIRPADYLEKAGLLNARLIAAHCCWLRKEECSLLGKHGVSCSHNPASNMKLASGGVMPIPELVQARANVCLGTDGPASNNSLSMFEAMKLCALVQKASRWDATVANAQQVLDFATRNGARALGMNAGSVEEGKLADVVLLDLGAPNLVPSHNIVSNIVYAANGGNVSDVVIDGKIVMRERKIVAFDEGKAVEGARKAAAALVSR
ncbi:MAG: amidohydrolase [Candidatus Micrarchaeia archaeon]|jgi:5-methylthioadenosine/S-adenosylhomocysteine deaminase